MERIKTIYTGIKGLSAEQIAPTVGLNVGKIVVGNARLNFWDLGGQRELHGIWEKYYSECHGVVFVVDSTDVQRIEQVKQTLGMIYYCYSLNLF